MTDVHSQETRSYNMSRIKAKDTKPELLVRKYLFCKGFRYRVNVKDLPGKPDIVLPKYKTVIFIHGCFWHGHEALRKTGWNIITVWECQLKPRKREQTLEGILLLLQKIYLDLQKKPIITPYTPPATEFPIVAEPPSPYGDD